MNIETSLRPPTCQTGCGCGGRNRADQCWADPWCDECYKFGNSFTEEEAAEALRNLGFTVVKTGEA